ncbi:MAG: 16S rRNA (uracil1498-N3)-methyltransferase [Myxococcota bacterium]|jgi:16S rRNA (uracil1498-N3)-methyltransferase
MRRFQVANVGVIGESIGLPADAAHHFVRVLRGRVGQTIELFDGAGNIAEATVQDIDDAAVTVIVDALRSIRATRSVTLVLAVIKGPAMDAAVRMATEAGVACVLPVISARSIAKGDRSDRWTRIATSAAQQSGRGDTPTIHPPTTLKEALQAVDGASLYIAMPGSAGLATGSKDAAVFVGPEGGWTLAEVNQVLAAGAHTISLGPWVLRADTAAAVAVAQALQR